MMNIQALVQNQIKENVTISLNTLCATLSFSFSRIVTFESHESAILPIEPILFPI